MSSYFSRMNKRERVLGALVAGILVLIIAVATLKFMMQKQSLLRAQLQTKKGELQSLELLAAERDTWAKRNMWLDTTQPKLPSQSGVGVALLEELKTIAKDHGVILESPELGLSDTKEYYQSVPVKIQTKSSWKGLIEFLQALQAPDRFVVIENSEVEVDSGDKTRMHGTFRIARWFAPAE